MNQNNKTGHFTCYKNRTFSFATDTHACLLAGRLSCCVGSAIPRLNQGGEWPTRLFPFRSFERFPHTIALSAVRRFLEIKLQLIGDLVRLRA